MNSTLAGINATIAACYGRMTAEACATKLASKYGIRSDAALPLVVAMWHVLESI